MSRIAYVNGRYVPFAEASVHIEDRGFQFSDSIYDTMALIGGTIADETGHLDRLERSLKEVRLEMPLPRRALSLVLREVVRRNRLSNAIIYVQVTRGQARRDFRMPVGIRPSLIVTVRSLKYDIEARKAAGKKAVTVRDIRWERRDIKTTMLLSQVLAREEAVDRGAQEAIFLDESGFVTEATSSNLWMVDKNNTLVTYPSDGTVILKGVTRTVIQALGKKEKMKIVERRFKTQELYKAKEVFTSSCSALFSSIVEIDGHKIGTGKPGPVVARLYDLYMGYVHGPKQTHWTAG